MNQRLHAAVAAILMACTAQARAAAMAHNDNFVVTAADEQTALDALVAAERSRREIALEWLGEELPDGIGRVILEVEIADADTGRTWTIDGQRSVRHMVWLTATRERALGSMLRHELTHVVLSTWAPGQIPAWASEGAASLADDEERVDDRRRAVAWFVRTGKWPALAELFDAESIAASERETYAAAASVTEFLLSRPAWTKRRFVRFSIQAKRDGYRSALADCYGISDVDDLERQWKAWATTKDSDRLFNREGE